MFLWQEYFLRHNMPLITPFEPFIEYSGFNFIINPSPPREHRRWIEFVAQNQESLISTECGQQLISWGVEIAEGRLNLLPSLNEQQTFIFRHIPRLEQFWSSFQPTSSWSCSNIAQDLRRMSISQVPVCPVLQYDL